MDHTSLDLCLRIDCLNSFFKTRKTIHAEEKNIFYSAVLKIIELSAEMVSKITDKILPQVKEWQSRPLNPVYPFVFMDCIH